MKVTRNTIRHDGSTVGQAMDKDAAFLRSVGIPAKDGAPTFDEIRERRREIVRQAVLDALDNKLGGKGWIDDDLPQLFATLDKQVERWEGRNPILALSVE